MRTNNIQKQVVIAKNTNMRILMLPYLATGHITPFVELAKKLADKGFFIDLCSTPINLSFIKRRVTDKYSSSIQLVEFQLPYLPELPPHYHTSNGLPLHLGDTLFKAFKMSKPQFSKILETKKPDFVIYDAFQPWPGGVASALNIPAIKFYTVNAAAFCFFDYLFFKPGKEFPFPSLYLRDFEKERLKCFDLVSELEEQVDKDNLSECDGIMLVDSSREIDGKYVDYLSKTSQIKIIPLGARFHQDMGGEETEEAELIKWLGKKKEHSTVFVSFGSEQTLTKEEMEEVAYGLELSDVDFMWVVKFREGGEVVKLEEALPRGFLERTGERGRVVEGWVPQVRILKHPSIGAFVSHCGWSSTLESIEFGVPIIAMPMHNIDQSLNARLMVENGVAVEVDRDANGKFLRAKLREAIKDVIDERTGDNLRRKMNSLCENMKSRREEEMDGVVQVIAQLCDKSQSKNALT